MLTQIYEEKKKKNKKKSFSSEFLLGRPFEKWGGAQDTPQSKIFIYLANRPAIEDENWFTI